jgi:hypothetical protein
MQTKNPSSANASKPEDDDTHDIAALKPKLASIRNSCRYMGDVSRAYFYKDILPLLESVYFGTRHYVVVESMDRLIAAKAEASTAVAKPILPGRSLLASQRLTERQRRQRTRKSDRLNRVRQSETTA